MNLNEKNVTDLGDPNKAKEQPTSNQLGDYNNV